jgi:hypothetical protein
MKRLGLVFGILGIVGCFLPFVLGISFWDLRAADGGWRVYLVLAAFAAPVLASQATRSGALLGVAGFGYVAWRVFGSDVLTILRHGSIGAILMVVGAFGGLLSSISALASSRE